MAGEGRDTVTTGADPADSLFLEFQQTLAGRYSIDRELGRGGMGVVYLAREVHLDRLVAIKLLPPSRAQQRSLRERFLREARVAAKLSHPNIIPIHAVEERGEFVFYVMAFVDGETLGDRIRSRGPLPGSEAVRLFREVAWALAYAHGQGVVHQDVKPDNILLEAATGRVLVTDFGIAAAMGEAAEEDVAGTPEFMSPEQVLRGVVDARTDLYGLGATAWYACTGRLLFDGGSATEILARQVAEPAPPLGGAGVAIPRRLAGLVDHCLAKDPADRPADAVMLAEQLAMAMEQRRELPAALRAFVKRYGRLDGGGTLAGLFMLLVGSNVAAVFLGGAAGFGVLAVGATLFPFAYLVASARRLTRLGFSHQDVAPAFLAEIEQAREELTVERRAGSQRIERLLGAIAKLGGATFGAGLGWLILSRVLGLVFPSTVGVLVGFSGAIGVTALLARVALVQRHSDVDTEFWAKVWNGRIGKLAFAIARKLVGRRAPTTAMTHRATELSLGLAAEQLYDALPAATRRQVGDLPALLERLQQDAQVLRKHYTELQEALAGVGGNAERPELAAVRAMRDQVQERLAEAVGALETIRLNLLKLHAGAATVASLTTQLELAAEVSAQVERLLQAREETERLLDPPA